MKLREKLGNVALTFVLGTQLTSVLTFSPFLNFHSRNSSTSRMSNNRGRKFLLHLRKLNNLFDFMQPQFGSAGRSSKVDKVDQFTSEEIEENSNLVARKTGCTQIEAQLALRRESNSVLYACMLISELQRAQLDAKTSLPITEGTADGSDGSIDWDSEFASLSAKILSNANGSDPEFDSFPMGADGLSDYSKIRKEQARQYELKRRFESGKKDGKWLPGKENPKPVDDEPWFTG